MKKYYDRIDIVDLAYQIIDLHNENIKLKGEVEHYKEMSKIHSESTRKSIKHSEDMIGIMLGACLDPESVINK